MNPALQIISLLVTSRLGPLDCLVILVQFKPVQNLAAGIWCWNKLFCLFLFDVQISQHRSADQRWDPECLLRAGGPAGRPGPLRHQDLLQRAGLRDVPGSPQPAPGQRRPARECPRLVLLQPTNESCDLSSGPAPARLGFSADCKIRNTVLKRRVQQSWVFTAEPLVNDETRLYLNDLFHKRQ